MSWANEGIGPLIKTVNKLQDALSAVSCGEFGLDLPQIAVVGSQSAGKSSVLENFVGCDFLPRGSGIVTRRPLILQLMNHKSEYGEFLHLKGKKFTDFDQIREEIEKETGRLIGDNKGISPVPITLTIYSPNVLNLTLIDLPGLTKVPVGDQPQDIENQIRNMIISYIERESCLILAVTASNQDLATSDALRLAKEVDPEGLRTIGVLTKLDLMDQGTDASEILNNKLIPLRRGYIGVVNRSQKDIDGRKGIEAALEAERRFFQSHPSYHSMADKMGTAYLQKVLNQQLTNHIRESLPALKDKLHRQLLGIEKVIGEDKYSDINDPERDSRALMAMLQQLQADFQGTILGNDFFDTSRLSSGAKINRIFHEKLPSELDRMVIDDNQLQKEIACAIKNATGINSGVFTPDQAFLAISRKQIELLCNPAIDCLRWVSAELSVVAKKCTYSMSKYSKLREETERLIKLALSENEKKTENQIRLDIRSELAYINTDHEDFIGLNHDEDIPLPPKRTNRPDDNVSRISLPDKNSGTILRKGHLYVSNVGLMKGGKGWFVLSTERFFWYKDEKEKETTFNITLDGLIFKDIQKGLLAKRYSFALYQTGKSYIYNDSKQVDFSCESQEDFNDWKAMFSRAGVHVDSQAPEVSPKDDESFVDEQDEKLKRRVQTIRGLVYSYIRIVNKNIKDQVPKKITCFLINELKRFIYGDLLRALLAKGESLMEEGPEDTKKMQELLGTHNSLKEALKIINEVDISTKL